MTMLHTPRSVRNVKTTDDFDIPVASNLPPDIAAVDDDLTLKDVEKLGERVVTHGGDGEGCTDEFPEIDTEKPSPIISKTKCLIILALLILISVLSYIAIPAKEESPKYAVSNPTDGSGGDDSPTLHSKPKLDDEAHKFDEEGNHDTDDDEHPSEPSKEKFDCFLERDELRHALLLSMKDETVQDKYGPPSDWCISATLTNFSGIFVDVEPHMLLGVSRWDVSHVTDMSHLFEGHPEFNEDISNWNVERVKDMSNMFYGATAFTSDISQWNVQNVENMDSMFGLAKKFDVDLGKWDVSKVTSMNSMFQGAKDFRGLGLETWNVGSVTSMSSMFRGATKFQGSVVAPWDVRNVRNMHAMFADCPSFNGDIGEWNVEKVTNMKKMFLHATEFHQILSAWEVKKATDLTSMFEGASMFSDNLCPWRFRLPSTVTVDDMFQDTNCPFTLTPVYPSGPFCFVC